MKMQFADVDGGNTFDWGQSAQAYAKYRDIYPIECSKTASADRKGT